MPRLLDVRRARSNGRAEAWGATMSDRAMLAQCERTILRLECERNEARKERDEARAEVESLRGELARLRAWATGERGEPSL